jgi:hypothetical protein
MFVVPYILVTYDFIQFQLDVLYALFLSWKSLSYRLTELNCQSVPAPVPALWNKTHQNHKNLWLYTAVVLLMMGANSIRNM